MADDDTASGSPPYGVGAPDPTARVIEMLATEVGHLRELMEARFVAVEQRFGAVGERLQLNELARVEQKADTRAAVEAALTAQKDAARELAIASDRAIAKSEHGTAREIAQMSATFGQGLAAITGALDDLKERVALTESGLREQAAVKVGGEEQKAAMYAFVGFLVALVVLGGFVAALWPT